MRSCLLWSLLLGCGQIGIQERDAAPGSDASAAVGDADRRRADAGDLGSDAAPGVDASMDSAADTASPLDAAADSPVDAPPLESGVMDVGSGVDGGGDSGPTDAGADAGPLTGTLGADLSLGELSITGAARMNGGILVAVNDPRSAHLVFFDAIAPMWVNSIGGRIASIASDGPTSVAVGQTVRRLPFVALVERSRIVRVDALDLLDGALHDVAADSRGYVAVGVSGSGSGILAVGTSLSLLTEVFRVDFGSKGPLSVDAVALSADVIFIMGSDDGRAQLFVTAIERSSLTPRWTVEIDRGSAHSLRLANARDEIVVVGADTARYLRVPDGAFARGFTFSDARILDYGVHDGVEHFLFTDGMAITNTALTMGRFTGFATGPRVSAVYVRGEGVMAIVTPTRSVAELVPFARNASFSCPSLSNRIDGVARAQDTAAALNPRLTPFVASLVSAGGAVGTVSEVRACP